MMAFHQLMGGQPQPLMGGPPQPQVAYRAPPQQQIAYGAPQQQIAYAAPQAVTAPGVSCQPATASYMLPAPQATYAALAQPNYAPTTISYGAPQAQVSYALATTYGAPPAQASISAPPPPPQVNYAPQQVTYQHPPQQVIYQPPPAQVNYQPPPPQVTYGAPPTHMSYAKLLAGPALTTSYGAPAPPMHMNYAAPQQARPALPTTYGAPPQMYAAAAPAYAQSQNLPLRSPHKQRRPQEPNTVPTIEHVEHLEPNEVRQLMQMHRVMLVDLRSEDRASGLIAGAIHVPAMGSMPFISQVPKLVQQWADKELVIFTCQYSAHRAPQCANWYRQRTSARQRVAIMSGGFRGWEADGLPVEKKAYQGTVARAADEDALKLGMQFIAGCSVNVPVPAGGSAYAVLF